MYNYYPYYQNGAAMVPNLQGKVVDSIEVARGAEVPIGGYGVFPKADLSEIYIKSWNNNGTTSVMTFRPIVEERKETVEEQINKLREEIAEVRAMIPNQTVAPSQNTAPVPAKEVRHEF